MSNKLYRARRLRGAAVGCLALGLLLLGAIPARAEMQQIRLSYGFGLNFLPLYVIEHDQLLEKEARAAGLGEVAASWRVLDGGNVINDAMLAGAVDIAAIGETGFLTLWAKAKGTRNETIGVSGIGGGPIYLNTRNLAVKTLADFTERDRIALPGIKTSHNAILLQMAAASAFGDANYAKLDPLTVGMPYPEAMAALLSGKTEIDSHFASTPFCLLELDHPEIHKVYDSTELTGRVTAIMSFATRQFQEANPKLVAAFVQAVDDAADSIRRDPARAARIYAEMAKVKIAESEVLRVIADPETVYTATPLGTMRFADFMQRVGLIKPKPARWQDLFGPAVQDRDGS